MAKSRYEYSTSPRKLEPDYKKKKQKKSKKLKVVEDLPRQGIKVSKAQKKRQIQLTLIVAVIFILLLLISYRNSQINEKFSEVQNLKKEVSSIQKENEQLKVNIENGLNSNNIEKLAKEKLGMQKLTSKQTKYISLPKKDYVESAKEEEVVMENDKNWFQQLLDSILNKE